MGSLETIARFVNPEVYVAKDGIVKPTLEAVAELKARALDTPRKRCRLLLHRSIDDTLHQMIIVNGRSSYVRPHRNVTSSKSWQIVEGRLTFVRFDDEGRVVEHCFLGTAPDTDSLVIRLSESCYHTLIPLTDQCVFLETILGPFRGTTYAPWAPEESNAPQARAYFRQLCRAVGVECE